MSLTAKLKGKVHAVGSLIQFRRNFRNWREVWSAYRGQRPMPPLTFHDGLTLHHGPNDDPIFLFREQFIDAPYTKGGFYQPSPGDTVLDLGANIGSFALYLQHVAPGIRVHCFEPSAFTRRQLNRNVVDNGLSQRVAVHPYAVSDRDSTAVLKQADQNIRRTILDEHQYSRPGDEETVEIISLDHAMRLCGDAPIDLLKVDVEGSEIEVLEGASVESWARIRRVALEFHDLFRPGCRERSTRVLADQGFTSIETDYEACHDNLVGTIRAARGTSTAA